MAMARAVRAAACLGLVLLLTCCTTPNQAEVGGCEYLSTGPLPVGEGGEPLQRDIRAALDGTATEMVVGALGIQGSSALFSQWNATFSTFLTATAGKQLNKTYRMVYLDWDTAFRATQDNCVDFVYSNPSLHLCLELQYQVTPLVTLLNFRNGFKLDRFYGTIIRRTDRDDINSLEDVKGKIVEAVSVTGLGGCQLQWYELLNNGINFMNDPKQVRFSYNQKATVKNVISGDIDVGMVRTDLAEAMDLNGEIDLDKIKVIHLQDDPDFPFPYSSSLAAPEWPLASLPHVPTATISRMANTLYTITPDTPAAVEGLYAGWVPPVTYMSLFTMMGDLGFLTNSRCSGNSNTYEAISCPADTLKVPENQIQVNCDALAAEDPRYACPQDYICVCSPCSDVSALTESAGAGPNMGLIAGVAVACLAAVSAVALAVWLSKKRKQPEASDLEKISYDVPDTYDSANTGSWNDVKELVSQMSQQTSTPKKTEGDCTVQELLASGGNARVYRALWRGATVAQKRIQLPSSFSALQKKKTSLAMEAAISTSMSHPNVVHTYHWEMVPIRRSMVPELGEVKRVLRSSTAPNLGARSGDLSQPDMDAATDEIVMWEMRIIQEFCELGSLTHVLSKGVLPGQSAPRTPPDIKAALYIAKDVACGMLHIHSMQIVHGDLKSGNVLLVEARRGESNYCAKVADFGLSVKMDENQTHVSGVHSGTLSHMSPELLTQGISAKPVDVYAFGILMYELFTGLKPWDGKNPAEIIHAVSAAQKRPVFPLHVPVPIVQLASECWHQQPEQRPKFDVVCDRLSDILTDTLATESVKEADISGSEDGTNPSSSIKSLQKTGATHRGPRPTRAASGRARFAAEATASSSASFDDTDDYDEGDTTMDPTIVFGMKGLSSEDKEN